MEPGREKRSAKSGPGRLEGMPAPSPVADGVWGYLYI